jgi:hypothetical protein
VIVIFLIASIILVAVMCRVHLESRDDFLIACENYFKYTGHRHYKDPKATVEDLYALFGYPTEGEK